MTGTVEDFAAEFLQDVLAASDANETLAADMFFERFCEHLLAAGELDSADRAAYRGPPRSGVAVDGYGGDPVDGDGGAISLIVSDFHQSPGIARLVQGEMNAIFRRLLSFVRRSLDPKWRNALEETSAAFGLADTIAARWRAIGKVRLFIISNRILSERVDGREADRLGGRTVTYNVWDIGRLYRFVAMADEREEVDIRLEDFGGFLPVLRARQPGAGHVSYLSIIPGQVLASIYDRWGARLLEQNVRVFLQARGKVNKGIRRTLEHDAAMFFAYNNGITATAEDIEIDEGDGHSMLKRIANFQIVNGGQTTASVHAAHRAGIDLSNVFVQMKLSVIDSAQATEAVPRISEFANSQNRVNASDFFANHPFHVRIEAFSRRMFAPSREGSFRQSKWFYERARGQYVDARARLSGAQRRKFDLENPRSQLFSKTDLAKFINVWEGKPDKASLGAQKNFAIFASDMGRRWERHEADFNEEWYRELIAKAIVFRASERIVSRQAWYRGGYRANIVAYAIAKIAHDVAEMNKTLNFQAIWRRQAPAASMELAIATTARQVHDVLVDPPADKGIGNVTEWAKKQACWSKVQRLQIELLRDFMDELITGEERKGAVRNARKVQRQLDGIQAQSAVVNAGGEFWNDALAWARARRLLSMTEVRALQVATRMPRKLPSEHQCAAILNVLSKLQTEGYPGSLTDNEG